MTNAHWFFRCTTEQEIKKRFHELMLIHHPDRGGNLQTCQEIVGQYHEALKELATLKSSVDYFFNTVMVMVDNQKLRNNRLALLKKLQELLCSVADIAYLM